MKKFFIYALILCVIATLITSCKNEKNETTEYESYQYTPSTEGEESTDSDDSDLQKAFKKDDSWHDNYEITYKYFNSEQDSNTVSIREKKTDSEFTVEYLESGEILYYKANGSDTDYYVISADSSQSVHSVLKGDKFSSLSSLFMKLSDVDQNLPRQTNVLYMYDEAVAGRSCHKYIQRAYSDAKLTQSVYVWIDSQYGFAAKCEVYDSSDQLIAMWETEKFSTGLLDDEDVKIDISKYNFIEDVG